MSIFPSQKAEFRPAIPYEEIVKTPKFKEEPLQDLVFFPKIDIVVTNIPKILKTQEALIVC